MKIATIPREVFSEWVEWIRPRFESEVPYPFIHEKVYDFDLLCDAYNLVSDNDGIREYLEGICRK